MKYQFKTNMKCEGCVEKLSPYLSANNEIRKWEVDMNGPVKILTVETDSLSSEMVEKIVRNAGFKAENLNQ